MYPPWYDPLFRDVKIVLSLTDSSFEGELDEGFKQRLEGEGIMDSNMKILESPSYENLYRFVIEYADGIVVTSPNADKELPARINDDSFPIRISNIFKSLLPLL